MSMLLAAALLATLSGCASGPARSVEQVVRVDTPGCDDARCTLRNDLGEWTIDPAPGEARVLTSSRPLEVSCRARTQLATTAKSAEPLRAPSDKSAAVGAGVGAGVTAAALAPALATPFAPFVAVAIVAGAATGAGAGQIVDASQRPWSYLSPVTLPMTCRTPTIEQATWGLAVVGVAGSDAVQVTAVAPGGRASAAGLRTGDLILAVDGQGVGSGQGFEARLRGIDRPLALRVSRDGQERLVTLDPPGAAR